MSTKACKGGDSERGKPVCRTEGIAELRHHAIPPISTIIVREKSSPELATSGVIGRRATRWTNDLH